MQQRLEAPLAEALLKAARKPENVTARLVDGEICYFY
jgi:hypothetical protein